MTRAGCGHQMFIVVIRREGSALSEIYRGDSLLRVLRVIRRKHGGRLITRWSTPAVDTFIRAHYRKDKSASEIARELTAMTRKTVTKNMVISRAQYLFADSEE